MILPVMVLPFSDTPLAPPSTLMPVGPGVVVRDIGAVESDIVAGDQVPGEDRPGLVGVHRDSRLAIADQPVANDDILVGGCLHCRESGWARGGEYPDPDAVA